MMQSEIIYNPDEVGHGKSLLSKIPENITSIAGEIEAGIAMVMSTTFKGSVNIDTTALQTSAQNVETTISDITTVEQKIMDYSKEGPYKNINGEMYPHWAAAISGGTFYSNPEGALNEMTDEYMDKKQELTILTQKVSQGTATPLEIAKAKELVMQVDKIEEKIENVKEQNSKNMANESKKEHLLIDGIDFENNTQSKVARQNLFNQEAKMLKQELTTNINDASARDEYYTKVRVLTRANELSTAADSITEQIANKMSSNNLSEAITRQNTRVRIELDKLVTKEDSVTLQAKTDMLESEIKSLKPYLSDSIITSLEGQVTEMKELQKNVDKALETIQPAREMHYEILDAIGK